MKLQIVPFEANIIAKAFKMYANGDALNDVVRMMNRECAPDRTWSKSGVEAMLQNPIYIGHRVRNRTKQVSHPGTEAVTTERIDDPSLWLSYDDETLRIVDQETWERVERRRASRSGGVRIEAPRVKLLTGLLVCGGKRPQGEPCEKTVTTSARNYYVCNGHYTGTCTSQVSFRREAIEALVLPALGQHLLPWVDRLAGAAMERHRTGQSDIQPLRQEHNKVRGEANRLLAAIQLGVLQGTALESMTRQYQTLHNEAEKLGSKIKSLLVEENTQEVRYDRAVAEQFLLNLAEALQANITEGRRFLGSVIDRIIVTDNGEPRTCPYCNAVLVKVTPRHLKKHGLNIKTYLKECPALGFTRSASLTVYLKEDGLLKEGKVFGLHTSMSAKDHRPTRSRREGTTPISPLRKTR